MRISDVLRGKGSSVATVEPATSVADLVASLAEHNVGALPVLENDRLIGIVSERDVVRRLHLGGAGLLQLRVADIMSTSVTTCGPTDKIEEIARVMTERRFRHMPVVEDDALVGIVSIGDLVKARIDLLEAEREQLVQSLQTLGGSGYLQDYPVEQYVRDAKIDSLYEGTTAIQSLDFLFRKIVRDNGAALGVVVGEIQEFLAAEAGNGRLKEERALLATALADVQGMLAALTGHLMKMELHVVGQHTVRLLMAVGDLLVGWLLLRQAEVALAALGAETGRDQAFYEGKVAVARFFAATQLPLLTAHRTIVEHADNSLMDVPEAAF